MSNIHSSCLSRVEVCRGTTSRDVVCRGASSRVAACRGVSALDTRALSSLRCRRSSPLVEDFRRSSVSRVRRVECRALCRPSARVDGSSGASRAGPRPVESRADAREDACEACARLRVSRAIKLMRVEVRGGSPRRKTSSVLCLECLSRSSEDE